MRKPRHHQQYKSTPTVNTTFVSSQKILAEKSVASRESWKYLCEKIIMNFQELHKQTSPLLICNVWDVASARAAQDAGFKAIGTSSSAIAATLGYEDGEEITFQELEYIVSRITKSINLPLTVDLEAGYSRDPNQIVENIIRLADLGVVGINLEDSIVDGDRKILDSDIFSHQLAQIRTLLHQQHRNIFINVRTDTFLLQLPNALDETVARAKQYKLAGANGLFVPCIELNSDIEQLVKEIDLPLNVMCMPKLVDFNALSTLGVKRISMGNFVFNKTTQYLEHQLKQIIQDNSFNNIFS